MLGFFLLIAFDLCFHFRLIVVTLLRPVLPGVRFVVDKAQSFALLSQLVELGG